MQEDRGIPLVCHRVRGDTFCIHLSNGRSIEFGREEALRILQGLRASLESAPLSPVSVRVELADPEGFQTC